MNNLNSTKTINFINNYLVIITIPGTIFGIVTRRFVKPTSLDVCVYMCALVCVSLHMSMFLYLYMCVDIIFLYVCIYVCVYLFVFVYTGMWLYM